MTPKPQHGTPAGDATIAIQQLARQTGGNVQELQTLYVLEALLARIAASDHSGDFVLKGGVLLAAYAARRPTKDIDLQVTGLPNAADEVTDRVREMAAINLNDGVVFDDGTVTSSVIRESDADEYLGVRIRIVGALGRARLTVGIDVNFGDPISPAPRHIELPRLVQVGQSPVILLGYPLTMVLAEKIVTAVDRGAGNTRWRDFADVYTLTRLRQVAADELSTSMATVAEYRQVTLTPLLPRLAEMPTRAQAKWRTWRSRTHREQELPESFGDVLRAVSDFADPALASSVTGLWDPVSAAWDLSADADSDMEAPDGLDPLPSTPGQVITDEMVSEALLDD